jgi:hypothetical protein
MGSSNFTTYSQIECVCRNAFDAVPSTGALSTGEHHTGRSPEGGKMQDLVVEMLAWLFVKTDEEVLAEAEITALHSMLLAEDPRQERAGNTG